MNATFNLRRLGLTIYRESLEKYRSALIFWAVFLLLYLAFWGLTIALGDTMHEGARAVNVISMLSLACCIAPFVLYKNENRRLDGIFYATSPSSTLEKTLSMFIITTLLFPILTTVLLLGLDSLLTVIPIDAGFRDSLWDEIFSSSKYLDSVTPMFTEETRSLSDRLFNSLSPFALNPYTGLLLTQSLFVFLNMLFRRHKIGMSLITAFSLFIIIVIIMASTVVGMVNEFGDNLEGLDSAIIDRMVALTKTLIVAGTWIVPLCMWVCTYFRIRRIQY